MAENREAPVLAIAEQGRRILRQRASAVPAPADPAVGALAAAMQATLEAAGGVGLAAPQVFEPWRLIVLAVPGQEGGAALGPIALANPSVTPLGKAVEVDWEGCLSIPGLIGWVPRHAAVRLSATALDGSPVTWDLTGLAARVAQHEVDHLDGIVYPERLADPASLALRARQEAPGTKLAADGPHRVVEAQPGAPALPEAAAGPAIGARARPAEPSRDT